MDEDKPRAAAAPELPQSLVGLDTYLLSKLGKAARGAVAERLAARGLRLWHMAVMAALADFGAQAQRDLALRLSIHPSDTAKIVDDLVTAGWVVSSRDPDDRRRVRVTLAQAGRTTLAELDAEARSVQEAILAPLDPGERALFSGLLRRLFDHVRGGAADYVTTDSDDRSMS